MEIFAFHLLNDYSGSPKVLSQILRGLASNNQRVTLVTSTKKTGFLTELENVNYIDNGYVFQKNPILRLWALFFSQLRIIFQFFRKIKKQDVIYINTVLPFGAAILGKIKGCKVVYHLHETSMKPPILKRFLFFVVKSCATEVIYVSNFLKKAEPLKVKSTVIYNALEPKFYQEAQKSQLKENPRKQVLMICSLKEYKGVWEYYELSEQFQKYDFDLVVNADQDEINQFFKDTKITNLKIYPRQSNVMPFYEKADLVMNLSRPDEWVETFGLTAIEAMAFGIPVIVPPVGGIAELVEDGVNGYKVSCYESTELKKMLMDVLDNCTTNKTMKENCLLRAKSFSEEIQISKVKEVLF